MSLLKSFVFKYALASLFLFAYSIIHLIHPHQTFGASDPLSSWIKSSKNLPYTLASHASMIAGNKLFIIGGANTDDYAQVYSSIINNDGSISDWQVDTHSLPETRYYISKTQHGNYIYVLGGALFDGAQNHKDAVYLSSIQSDGNISDWLLQNPLPQARSLGAAAVVGDWIYYAGGFDNTGYKQDIYYAHINSDGTLGSWSTSSISLPEPMMAFGMIEHHNNLIIIGGYGNSGFIYKTYKAAVNTGNGTISAWQETAPLTDPVYRAGVIKVDNTVFAVGGAQTKVYFSTLNSDGTLGAWNLSAHSLPKAGTGNPVVYNNGYLYITGGYNGSEGYLNTVYYTKLQNEIDLSVPRLLQTDPAWGSQEYDSALGWAPQSPGISSWGCAMTSAAMVFQYHGIIKLPDGTDLNPATLNTWLKNAPDGYVGNGLVNWLALSRLSKLAKAQNPSFAFDALEYSRTSGANKTQLKTDLENNRPDILEETGHFIVAKGTSGETFTINDPYYNRTDLNSYSNTFLSLSRYIPSHTDLSYIMLVIDPDINLTVKNSAGDDVGSQFIQQPLQNAETGNGLSGAPLKIFYLPKASSGTYTATVSGNVTQTYSLKAYLYDENGNVKVLTKEGSLSNNNPDTFSLIFDKQNSDNSITDRAIQWQNLLDDIEKMKNLKLIKPYLARQFISTLKEHKYENKLPNPRSDKLLRLRLVQVDLNANRRSDVKEQAYQILMYDVKYLVNHL